MNPKKTSRCNKKSGKRANTKNKLPFWSLIVLDWVMKMVCQSCYSCTNWCMPVQDLFALLRCVKMCMCVMCFTPQALEWNWMTSLETIHQALNSVAFYIIATWDLFTVYFSVLLLHQWLSSQFQSLGSPPNSAPTLLPTKLILPPWLEQATLLEKHLPVAKLHSTSGNLVLDSWELDLQKSLGMSLFYFLKLCRLCYDGIW